MRIPGRGEPSTVRPLSLALGAGALAVTAAGVAWRAVHGAEAEDSPEEIAALTAQSVHNAARAHVIEAVETGTTDGGSSPLSTAAAQAVHEAAVAGADVTAAAIGALDAAAQVYRVLGIDRREALDAASTGAVTAAFALGRPAGERVREVLASRTR